MVISQPGMTMGQPGITMGQPGMTVGQPGMTMGQPGMTMGQPGMVQQPGMSLQSQMPIPHPQSQPGMMPGFVQGISAGALSLPPSSTVAAQSPLDMDIFVGPPSGDTAGPPQTAAQQELRQQQQKTIWSG